MSVLVGMYRTLIVQVSPEIMRLLPMGQVVPVTSKIAGTRRQMLWMEMSRRPRLLSVSTLKATDGGLIRPNSKLAGSLTRGEKVSPSAMALEPPARINVINNFFIFLFPPRAINSKIKGTEDPTFSRVLRFDKCTVGFVDESGGA